MRWLNILPGSNKPAVEMDTFAQNTEMIAGLEWQTSSEPVDYETAHAAMEARVTSIHDGNQPELLWFLEHPPLYTAGTSARAEDLLEPERFPVHKVGRGGQYTYHGPGQRVVYTMLDLKNRESDVRKFVRDLEAWVIDSLAEFGVSGERREDRVGIWVDLENGREKKIAAIGIRVRHWITFHGIAINVNPELEHFSGIVPCGIAEHGVTSLHDLGIDCTMADVDAILKATFIQKFTESV
tara:strand:+ start:123 stop:839 length:717 start_codon:yes stop_codon:yes gene_type:complete